MICAARHARNDYQSGGHTDRRRVGKRLRVDDYKSYGTLGNPMDMCDGKTVCTPPDQKRRRLKKQSRHKLADFQNSFFISIALKHRTCQMAGVS